MVATAVGCRCVVPASCRVVRAFVASSRLRRVIRAFVVSSGRLLCRVLVVGRWSCRPGVRPALVVSSVRPRLGCVVRPSPPRSCRPSPPWSCRVGLPVLVASSLRSSCRPRVCQVVSFPVVVAWSRWRSSTSVTWHLRSVVCGCQSAWVGWFGVRTLLLFRRRRRRRWAVVLDSGWWGSSSPYRRWWALVGARGWLRSLAAVVVDGGRGWWWLTTGGGGGWRKSW